MNTPNTDREYIIAMALEEDDRSSITDAAARYCIPRSTLRGQAKEKKQRLTAEQKEGLAQWILREESVGRAPTRLQIQTFATIIAAQAGQKNAIGKNWVARFFERHSDIQIKPSKELESARARSVTKEGLADYNESFDDLIKQLYTGTARIINVDETGV
ncbi:hypothetical protein AUP68_16997 [Ilyonectria robusta]